MNCATKQTIANRFAKSARCRPRKPSSHRFAPLKKTSIEQPPTQKLSGKPNPTFGSLELLQDCLKTAMESKSRSALWPNRIAYLLHGDTNVACLLDYQSFSMDSSPIEQIFRPASTVSPEPRFRRPVQNNKAVTTLQAFSTKVPVEMTTDAFPFTFKFLRPTRPHSAKSSAYIG